MAEDHAKVSLDRNQEMSHLQASYADGKAPVGELPVDQGPAVAADEDDKNFVEGFAAKGGDTIPVAQEAQEAIVEHGEDDHDRYQGN
ncbi:hypothetical protein MTO96_011466 [Rhipicephalus appendiculatus]